MKSLVLSRGYKNVRYTHKIDVNIILDESALKHIQIDFKPNSILSRDILDGCIKARIKKIAVDYDNKVNKLLDMLILNIDLEKYSISNLSRLVKSVMRVTKSLSNSLTSIVIGLEDSK